MLFAITRAVEIIYGPTDYYVRMREVVLSLVVFVFYKN